MSNEHAGSLLRESAIRHRLLGPPSAPVLALGNTVRLQICIWSCLLLLASYLLTKTTYKETVAVRGLLEPVQGVQEIVSPVAARVEYIHVGQGTRVDTGDILATLSTGHYNAEGGSTLEENIRQLRSDRELLVEQLRVQQQSRQQSAHWTEQAVEHAHANTRSIEQESELLATRVKLSERNLQAVSRILQSGNSSAREYDLQYQAHLELLGRAQVLAQRLLQYEHELHALSNAQRLRDYDTEQASLQIQRELRQIDQRIMSLHDQAVFTVVAQKPGIVAELGLALGEAVRQNQPLIFINPIRTALQATLYAPAAVQAKLALGQTVLLRYDAFDYRLHGRAEARIVSIGQARLDPRENRLPIAGINEPVFKVVAELKQSTVQGDEMYVLKSGSTLLADFVLSEMSLLQFIFKPILGLQGKVA